MLPSATSLEGQRIPNVTLRTRSNHQWKDVVTGDLFNDKTVVVFSLPGAYTPTCSSTHLPRYNELAKPGCPHCARAKALLEAKGYRYDEISLGKLVTSSTLRAVSGSGTWPQVFIGGKLIGSADDMEAYFATLEAA